MAHRSRGPRNKTRHKLSKKPRDRGLPPVTQFVQKFSVGDKVAVIVEPAVKHGKPPARFHGLCGKITEKRGAGYAVSVNDMGKMKSFMTTPVHLKRMVS